MQRRALLSVLGGLAAGCTTAPSRPGANTPTGMTDDVYRLSIPEVEKSTEHPRVRYVLGPTAFYSAAAVERERDGSGNIVVRDVSEVESAGAQEVLRTAVQASDWRGDELPPGLRAAVAEVDFFTGLSEGTHTHVSLTLHRLDPDRPHALTFEASVREAAVGPDGPGRVAFSLHNTGERRQSIFSGTVPPFGLVWARHTERGGSFLLWRPYTEEGCVGFGEQGVFSCDIGLETPINPGETITREYAVLPPTTDTHAKYTAPPAAGRYRIEEGLSYRHGQEPHSVLSLTVHLVLEAV